MPEIYRHRRLLPDIHLGTIDKRDRIYFTDMPKLELGRIDYQRGKLRGPVPGMEPDLVRVDDENRILLILPDGSEHPLGYVKADGRIYKRSRFWFDHYVGYVEEMRHPIEAAAAMVFFLMPMIGV